MSSTERALNIPEILELILLSLPESTLLTTAQLVSKEWHGHITSSSRIQQAMFFTPSSRPVPHRLNPLLATHFPIFFDEEEHSLYDFKKLCFGTSGCDKSSDLSDVSRDSNSHALREKFLWPSASWRRMLPSQPPITELPYLSYTTYWGNWSEGFLDFDRPSHSNPDINARHDGWGPTADATNVDGRGSCTWTMGHFYDMAMSGTWRIVWNVQAHILREAATNRPYPSDGEEYPLKANVRIARPIVDEGSVDGSADLKIPLSDALKGHEVYFAGIYHRSCSGGSWGGASSKLKRYYKFPAVDLDAPSSSSDDDWDDDGDDESEEEDDA